MMNVMLASGGYSWTVFRLKDRRAYLAALYRASIDTEIKLFTAFLADRARWFMEKHDLEFPDKGEKEDFDRDTIIFFGQHGKKRVRCAILGQQGCNPVPRNFIKDRNPTQQACCFPLVLREC